MTASNYIRASTLSKQEMYGKYWLRMHQDFIVLMYSNSSSTHTNNLSSEE